MLAMWVGFAVGAEISIVADSALVTHTLDVIMFVLAERAITVDANVARWEAARG